MARVIGEGLVRIRPDTSRFGPEAERSLNSAMHRTVGRLEQVLTRLEPIAARVGARVGQRFTAGVEQNTSRLRPLLAGLFRVGGIVALGAGMAYLTAQAIALTSAIIPAAGAVALLPAVAAATAVGFGVLALATANLGDALADATGGGGARAAAAAYEAAQRRIAAAQRDAQRAAQSLLEVRKEEAQRIRDLALDVEGAALSQERAARGAADAQRALAAAQASGDTDAIAEADLAYRESLHTLQEATARHGDLAAQKAKADQAGVEGSRAVQEALQRQRDAQQELADAQKAAASASAGTAGAVSKQAQAYAKLSPAARDLVDTLKALSPAWSGLQRLVQQRVWAGVASDVRTLSGLYLPVLTRRLGENGGAWNTAIRQTAKLSMSKAFVNDVDTALANTARTSDRLARAVAPIVSALRHIGVVGSSILPGVADGVLRLAQRFETWAAAARESGQLGRWMSNGLSVLRQLGAIAANVGGIIAAIFRAGGADAGADMLAGLESGTARLKAFLNSAEGQQRISEVLTSIRGIVGSLAAALPRLAAAAAQLGPALSDAAGEGGGLHDALTVTDVVVGFLSDHIDLLGQALPYLAAGFLALKASQAAANVAAVVSLPIRALEAAAQFRMRAALNANTAALGRNAAATRAAAGAQAAETAATNTGILARTRAAVAATAQRVATVAATVATKAAAAGQWLLNAAMTANPLGLVLIAIVALVAGIALLWKNSETFRTIVIGAWTAIKTAAVAVFDWLKAYFVFVFNVYKKAFQIVADAAKWVWDKVTDWFTKIVLFVTGLPGKIRSAAKGLFDGIVAAAKGGINTVIDMWNKLDFELNIKIPDWVPPPFGGKGFHIPDLFPDIPRLAAGGVARARPGGILANIAEGGEDEVVAPLSTLAAMIAAAVRDAGGGSGITVENLIVKAFTDRFSLRQVQEELAMHGVH